MSGVYDGSSLRKIKNATFIKKMTIYEKKSDGPKEIRDEINFENGKIISHISYAYDSYEDKYYYNENGLLKKIESYTIDENPKRLLETDTYDYEDGGNRRNRYINGKLYEIDTKKKEGKLFKYTSGYADGTNSDNYSIKFDNDNISLYNALGIINNFEYKEGRVSKVLVTYMNDDGSLSYMNENDIIYKDLESFEIKRYEYDDKKDNSTKRLVRTDEYSNFDKYGNWTTLNCIYPGKETRIIYLREFEYL